MIVEIVRDSCVNRDTKTISCDPRLHEVPICFKIPANPEWITQLTADPAIRYWELVICAARPGIDFRTTFPLPIYNTDSSAIFNGQN